MITEQRILEIVRKKGVAKSGDIVDVFGVSRQYATKVLSRLVENGKLNKIGSTRYAVYATEEYLQKHPSFMPNNYSKTVQNVDLEESNILTDIENNFKPFSTIPENIKSIFEYAFLEMVNNAIDHSKSKKIKYTVRLDRETLSFIVDDFGVGVYRNIMKKRGLNSETEAIQDLLKGKATTAPRQHSGEGIFFTSKVGDEFVLLSYGYKLTTNNRLSDVFVEKVRGQKLGTRVTFRVEINCKKHLSDVFNEYAGVGGGEEHGFDKTEVRVKLYIMGGIHTSRSQARRVLSGLEKFKVVVLDFDKVPTVGQAFADEIFRVFHNKYPQIKLITENMSEGVEFMVTRAKTEAKVGR